MASNRKTLLLPKTLAQAGWDLLQTRDDIEAVPYPIGITNSDLRPLLHDVSGLARAPPPFRDPALTAAPRLQAGAREPPGFPSVGAAGATPRPHPPPARAI